MFSNTLVLMIITRFRHSFLFVLTLLTLSGAWQQEASAQKVFEYEMRQCIERQRNSRCGIAIQSLAFFQKNALMYLWHRTSQREKNLEAFNKKVDLQANFLAEFLSVYNRLANNAQFTEAQQEQWRRFFTETSLRHPMFNDLNETITLQFLDKEERSPSPFSLDTDWEAAYRKIARQAKKEGCNLNLGNRTPNSAERTPQRKTHAEPPDESKPSGANSAGKECKFRTIQNGVNTWPFLIIYVYLPHTAKRQILLHTAR